MVKINREFQSQSMKTKLILQVHDELIFDCLLDEIDNVKKININKDPRGREKPSDHTPIEIELA